MVMAFSMFLRLSGFIKLIKNLQNFKDHINSADQKEEVTLLLVCNSKSFIGTNPYYASKKFRPPVDLYLISEKSIWKNQVR